MINTKTCVQISVSQTPSKTQSTIVQGDSDCDVKYDVILNLNYQYILKSY